MTFVGILSQVKLLFGPLVIQLVWYILKQLFTSVLVKVVAVYLPPLRWIIVKYKNRFLILKMIWETSIHHFLWLDFILKYVFKKLLSAPPPPAPPYDHPVNTTTLYWPPSTYELAGAPKGLVRDEGWLTQVTLGVRLVKILPVGWLPV